MEAQSKLTQKSNIIIFSGNGQNKNKTNFKYDDDDDDDDDTFINVSKL